LADAGQYLQTGLINRGRRRILIIKIHIADEFQIPSPVAFHHDRPKMFFGQKIISLVRADVNFFLM